MALKSRTKGAWLISHARKLQGVNTLGQFDNIASAGKFGVILSVLASSDEVGFTMDSVQLLAKANGIGALELPSLLKFMEERHLIKRSKNGDKISLVGITHGSVLEHTAGVFDNLKPEAEEQIAVEIAELVSEAPVHSGRMQSFVSDTFKVPTARTREILTQAEEIGFIDAQALDNSNEKLYFNGNIFRVSDATKTLKVLQSLSQAEQRVVHEFQGALAGRGFATVDEAKHQVGPKLFEKLQAIAMFDVNRVANQSEEVLYVTRPASFAKYGNPWEEDTLDYAKALVSSLAYGMTRSGSGRGRITMLQLLLQKLIRGEWLNENTAAGEDYRYLEMQRVVETKPGVRPGCYNMRLLKREVGIIALDVLTQGVSSSEALLERLPSSSVTTYDGPEANRVRVRKRKTVDVPDRKITDMLQALRTGRLG